MSGTAFDDVRDMLALRPWGQRVLTLEAGELMKRWTFLLFGAFVSACAVKPVTAPAAPQFAFCPPAKFANCTVAKCQLQPNGNYTCWCFEDDRYSAAAWAGSRVAGGRLSPATRTQ